MKKLGLVMLILGTLLLVGCGTNGEKECKNQAEQLATLYSRSSIDDMYIKYDNEVGTCSIGYSIKQQGGREYYILFNNKNVFNCETQLGQFGTTDQDCYTLYHSLVNDYGMTYYRYGEK